MGIGLTFAVFVACGLGAGFFAGLFGIGGGLVMVPVLVFAFTTSGMAAEHVVAMALGTSLAAIVFSAAQSAYGDYRRGSASIEVLRRVAPWVVIGVVLGSAVAAETPSTTLLIFVGAFQIFAAALMVADVSRLSALQVATKRSFALSACSLAFGCIAA